MLSNSGGTSSNNASDRYVAQSQESELAASLNTTPTLGYHTYRGLCELVSEPFGQCPQSSCELVIAESVHCHLTIRVKPLMFS